MGSKKIGNASGIPDEERLNMLICGKTNAEILAEDPADEYHKLHPDEFAQDRIDFTPSFATFLRGEPNCGKRTPRNFRLWVSPEMLRIIQRGRP
jgi:hypothetical protein